MEVLGIDASVRGVAVARRMAEGVTHLRFEAVLARELPAGRRLLHALRRAVRIDLPDKIRFYLGNDELRRAIAAAGYRRIQREHTYDHRFPEIFRHMGLPEGE